MGVSVGECDFSYMSGCNGGGGGAQVGRRLGLHTHEERPSIQTAAPPSTYAPHLTLSSCSSSSAHTLKSHITFTLALNHTDTHDPDRPRSVPWLAGCCAVGQRRTPRACYQLKIINVECFFECSSQSRTEESVRGMGVVLGWNVFIQMNPNHTGVYID